MSFSKMSHASKHHLLKTFYLQRSKHSYHDCMLPDMHHSWTTQHFSPRFRVLPVSQCTQSLTTCCSRWTSFHRNLSPPEVCHMATNSHSVLSDGERLPAPFYTPNDFHLKPVYTLSKKTGPLQLIRHNFPNSQHLLIIFGRETTLFHCQLTTVISS